MLIIWPMKRPQKFLSPKVRRPESTCRKITREGRSDEAVGMERCLRPRTQSIWDGCDQMGRGGVRALRKVSKVASLG